MITKLYHRDAIERTVKLIEDFGTPWITLILDYSMKRWKRKMADQGTLISEESYHEETWLENGWFKLGRKNRPWLFKKKNPSLTVIVLYSL